MSTKKAHRAMSPLIAVVRNPLRASCALPLIGPSGCINAPDSKTATKLTGSETVHPSPIQYIAVLNMGGDHHHFNPEAVPRRDQDLTALADAQVPLAFRDTCAHLLLPLNKCRRETWWNPSQCGHERHTYEECLYNSYLQRCEAKVQENQVLASRKTDASKE